MEQPDINKRGWRAWHIFLHNSSALERLIVEMIAPEVLHHRKAGTPIFWIRYWENGPHVRLRLKDVDGEYFNLLGERLGIFAKDLAAASPPPPNSFGPEMRFDGREPDKKALEWFPQGLVKEINYIPETRRYGGADALELNEGLFSASSELAVRVIGATPNRFEQRKAFALFATAVSIGAAVNNRRLFASFLTGMEIMWRPFVTSVSLAEERAIQALSASPKQISQMIEAGLQETGDIPSLIRSWREQVKHYLLQLYELEAQKKLISPVTGASPVNTEEVSAAILSMVLSQIHMSNNRLGISPADEFLFARVLNLALVN